MPRLPCQIEKRLRQPLYTVLVLGGLLWLANCGVSASDTVTDSDDDVADAIDFPDYNQLAAESPVEDVDFTVSSTFGPRLKSSEDNRYDFHRGIDIPGERGDAILAIAAGEIVKVYDEGSTAYPNGGRVVVVQHTVIDDFTFRGTQITQYNSLYLHLDSFSAKALEVLESGEQQSVSVGEALGGMGDSGSTDSVHLHFEIRLQTVCSLEHQLENPDLDCSQYGFDPHIHPLDLFVSALSNDDVYDLQLTMDGTTLNVTATAERPYFNVDGIAIAIFTDATESDLVWEKSLSYNLRTGFDATSTASLDTAELESVVVSPHSLGSSLETYQIDFAVDLSSHTTGHFAKVSLLTTRGVVQEETIEF